MSGPTPSCRSFPTSAPPPPISSFVVEKLFVIPGLGQHFVNGCLNKDIPLVLGAVLVYSALVVVFNLLVDVAYAAVDPRITL
jgi:oligopeptide transport system permease protein